MIALTRFARKYLPGFESAYILDTAGHIGIRETRRIIGNYVLEERDIVEGRQFADSIAVDSNRNSPGGEKGHNPDGGEGSTEDPDIRQRSAPLITYEIPYRVLLPKDIDDLIVAGRPISVTHFADAFTRNQPACIGTGQAAGVAAALAVRTGTSPAHIDISVLQVALRESGVVLDRNEMKRRIEESGIEVY